MFYQKSLESAERSALKKSYPEQFTAVMRMLSRLDLIGIAFVDDEEYDLEAADVLVNLPHCASAADVRQLIFEVFSHWFSDDLAKPVLSADESYFEELLQLNAS